jgi:tyrosyl-DNA phosphodiesterase 1
MFRAIALSLQDATNSRPQPTVIDISSDDDSYEEEFQQELHQALQASKAEQGDESISTTQLSTPPPQASSFLSERALLEKERLERQKRFRKEGGLDTDNQETMLPHRKHVPKSPMPIDNTNIAVASSSRIPSQVTDTKPSEHLFWNGELRQIANMHAHPRNDGKPTFRLTEILGKVRFCSIDIQCQR